MKGEPSSFSHGNNDKLSAVQALLTGAFVKGSGQYITGHLAFGGEVCVDTGD